MFTLVLAFSFGQNKTVALCGPFLFNKVFFLVFSKK